MTDSDTLKPGGRDVLDSSAAPPSPPRPRLAARTRGGRYGEERPSKDILPCTPSRLPTPLRPLAAAARRFRRLLATPDKARRVREWGRVHLGLARRMSWTARLHAWGLGLRGDGAGAMAIWRRLARQSADRGDHGAAVIAWTELGRYGLRYGRLMEAALALDRACALSPRHVPARRLLAMCRTEQQDWPAAAAGWRAVLDGLPPAAAAERCQALRGLGEALIEQGMFNEAQSLVGELRNAAPADAYVLQAMAAEHRFDDAAAGRAWEELHRHHPAAATRHPAWLKHRGGADTDDDARHTAADVMAAPDADAAQRVLFYLEPRLPYRQYLELADAAARRFPDSAALQSWRIDILLDSLHHDDDLGRAVALSHAFVDRFPRHAHGRRLLARAAVAANDIDTVDRIAHSSGREDLAIWLAAKRGEHAKAKTLHRQWAAKRHILAQDGKGLDLRPLNTVPRQPFNDKILLFAHFRDEMLFLPWFLHYYRSIGVDWFFIVDNDSADGTAQTLAAQKDVTVYSSRDKVALAGAGMRWINELIRRHGRDNWCVYVDADEQLVAPGMETHGLRGLVDGMRERGEEAMPGFALDTQPQDMAALREFQSGDDPLQYSRLIDTDYYFFGNLSCCYFKARGGVRDRLFGARDKLEQTPIIRGGGQGDDPSDGPGVLYQNHHSVDHARASARSVASLHHKIMREALAAREPRTDNRRVSERELPARALAGRYRRSGLLAMNGDLPRGPNTVTYESPAQLESVGLLDRSAATPTPPRPRLAARARERQALDTV